MTIQDLAVLCVPASALFLLWVDTRRAERIDREFRASRPDLYGEEN